MKCSVLKSFLFSHDGVTVEQAKAGDRVDIPNGLVPGLCGEGYIAEIAEKATTAPPENKAIQRAEENQAEDAAPENKGGFSRDDIADMGKADVIDLLEIHGVTADKRKNVAKLRSELSRVMFIG